MSAGGGRLFDRFEGYVTRLYYSLNEEDFNCLAVVALLQLSRPSQGVVRHQLVHDGSECDFDGVYRVFVVFVLRRGG